MVGWEKLWNGFWRLLESACLGLGWYFCGVDRDGGLCQKLGSGEKSIEPRSRRLLSRGAPHLNHHYSSTSIWSTSLELVSFLPQPRGTF